MRAQRREALWPGALQQKRAESTSCRCSTAINYLATALAYLSVCMVTERYARAVALICKGSGMHRDQYCRHSNNYTIPVMLMRRESTAVTLALDALYTSAILNMQASLIDTALFIAGVGDDNLVTASA